MNPGRVIHWIEEDVEIELTGGLIKREKGIRSRSNLRVRDASAFGIVAGATDRRSDNQGLISTCYTEE